MNKQEARAMLRKALEKSGSGWVFQFWGNDADKHLDKVLAGLKRFTQEYHKRFGDRPDPFALLEMNPTKGAAFFQVDTLVVSVEMQVMIWRILSGCELARIKFNYEAGKKISFTVVLRTLQGKNEKYLGKQGDVRVLRHFGIGGVDERIVLQGYYAARGVCAL